MNNALNNLVNISLVKVVLLSTELGQVASMCHTGCADQRLFKSKLSVEDHVAQSAVCITHALYQSIK